MKKKTIYLLGVSTFLLAGCSQYEAFLDQKKESNEPEIVEVEQEVDITMPATLDEIKAAYESFDYLTLGDMIYQTNEPFKQIQPGYQIIVDELTLFEVAEADETLERDFNYANQPSGLILAHVTVENTTSEAFYLTVDELTQSYVGGESFATPSSNAYPLLHGNLRDILLENQGKVEAGETVSGYLVYGLGKKSLEEIESQGHFYLTIEPPVLDADALGGERENALGRSQNLFLPVDEKNEAELKELQAFIPDRLTSEWWGDKELLAQAQLDEAIKTSDDAVEVTLMRAEIADFEPFPAHEESFKNFPNGQVIVTVEYEVTNHSAETLLPVDGIATLYIDEDPILSDYVLMNELYGLELESGESATLVKSFALDKMYYQQHWQDKPIGIEINIPTASQEMVTSNEVDSEEEEEIDFDESYVVTFDWMPHLSLWINDDLKLEHHSRSDRSLIEHLESRTNSTADEEDQEDELQEAIEEGDE
ncbi:hypothetical protein [Dolosicoccus paucivorans]|uniref:hypothetical protein n=1 Tax=Dolosicoccus paucivorans TaxID=84521 RepID=UPI00088DFD48|nr:hypothetical protein [Dolosicoccus paucivorans]SDI84360.1 hypothetical protein SAMN04487994_10577 [Dolosicoccus paucivorans]